MMGTWQDILFFEGENPEALRQQFIELSVTYAQHSPFQIAQEVFRPLKDNSLRAMQAAQVWSTDLDTQEQIRQRRVKGPESLQCEEDDLIRRALQIADDIDVSAKDRVAALRLAGELKGFVKKSVDIKSSDTENKNPVELLNAISKLLPV